MVNFKEKAGFSQIKPTKNKSSRNWRLGAG
jgi:hypothetical protein